VANNYPSTKDDLAVEMVIDAMVAYPTLTMAKEFLKEHGYDTDLKKLKSWRDNKFADRYQKRRKELGPKIEAMLADDMLGNARLASEVEKLAIEQTAKLLKQGKVQDPSRVARDLKQTQTQGIDKRLAMEGRPTQIHESRNVDELVRALEGMGVARQVEVTQIEQGGSDG
jgi:hypothetical protein